MFQKSNIETYLKIKFDRSYGDWMNKLNQVRIIQDGEQVDEVNTELSPKQIRNAIRFKESSIDTKHKRGRKNKVLQYTSMISHCLDNDAKVLAASKWLDAKKDLSRVTRWRIRKELEERGHSIDEFEDQLEFAKERELHDIKKL